MVTSSERKAHYSVWSTGPGSGTSDVTPAYPHAPCEVTLDTWRSGLESFSRTATGPEQDAVFQKCPYFVGSNFCAIFESAYTTKVSELECFHEHSEEDDRHVQSLGSRLASRPKRVIPHSCSQPSWKALRTSISLKPWPYRWIIRMAAQAQGLDHR